MTRRFAPLFVLLSVPLLAACARSGEVKASTGEARGGLDLAGVDKTVRPGDDFFDYANGAWSKATEIPADRASYGNGAILDERTSKRTAALIEDAAKADAPAGSDARKIGDYFASYMDEAAIDSKGLAPLQPALDAIAAIGDKQQLATALGAALRADVDVLNATNFQTGNLFGLWVAQDFDDPSKYSAFILQGGLGLPDRDYYLAPSPRMEQIRKDYLAHMTSMLSLAKQPDAADKAQKIFDLEHRMAELHTSRGDSEDVIKGNNHWPRGKLDESAPGLDWQAFLTAAHLDGQSVFVIWQPAAIVGLAKLVGEVPLETWKAWMTEHQLERYAGVLPKAFYDEAFDFFGKKLSGAQKPRPRWRRAVGATDGALGEVVGKLYVEKYFPASEKARVEQMVKNELEAFRKRIDALDWMAPATKEQAKAKLSALRVGVGYPDKWRDYSGLEVVKGDALGNAQRASLFTLQWNLARLGQPVDRGEWVMNPQLVNAVNLPAMNALNFPAAILQPPNLDPTRPEVMDYGATGSVIGHEISHSFDDQGALFDAQGRLRNWWTEADFAHFKESGEKLVKQFDGYQPFPDLHVNGRQTISENIADLAGLAAAYDAYRASLGGKEAPEYQGLTGDQQFFLSFAQSWRTKMREQLLRQLIVVDGHAPAMYRVETVRNIDAWYSAFDVKPGEKLFLSPADRVRVW